jgi:hypothetical protein
MFEKEAEEAIKKKYSRSVQGYKSLIRNWQEGAKFGYKKANEWHNLKESPDDLPKEEAEYLVIFESDGTRYTGLEIYYPDTKEWSTICNIIAWWEIPTYTEE